MSEKRNEISALELIQHESYVEKLKILNETLIQKTGQPKAYFIQTFGCQMNENDSEKLAGTLENAGFIEASKRKDADFIIFNTCCVRENAEKKVYGHLGALKKLKEERPDLIIGVCGCMMHQPKVADHIKKVYRHVDIIFGNANQFKLPEMLFRVMNENATIYDVALEETRIAETNEIKHKYTMKAFVTIMYGCDNFCSYCIVPYVRGRERSRAPAHILEEVSQLAAQGCKEIMVLGQNVNSYGKDLEPALSFSELLNQLCKIQGIERIRFMTSHPKDISDELIEVIARQEKVCNHLHLPIQSGSTKVLEEMNRRYTQEHYLELVQKIQRLHPEIALTTDIIVGFPGETEEDFAETLRVMEKVRFDAAFTFLYSKRTGTPAAERLDQVSEEVKMVRFEQLLEVQNRISRELNDPYLGTVQKVLVEGFSKGNINTLTGRTESNKVVNFPGDEKFIGKIVNVKIDTIQTWSLEGTIVGGELF